MFKNCVAFWTQVAEMAAMAGFSGKVRKPKAAAPKLGKRVSRKVVVAPQPAASELSDEPGDADGDADEDFGGDEADMDEEVVGESYSDPHRVYSAVPVLRQAVGRFGTELFMLASTAGTAWIPS